MKKNCSCLLLVLFTVFITFTPVRIHVQAQTFTDIFYPGFGLCLGNNKDTEISHENINFSMDAFSEAYGNNFTTVQAEYKVTNHGNSGMFDLYVPFIDSAADNDKVQTFINGSKINGTINYGEIWYTDNAKIDGLLSKTVAPELSDAEYGTLYTFAPAESLLTIKMKHLENQSIIHDETGGVSRYETGYGYWNLSFENANTENPFYLYVTHGDFPEPPESNAEYIKKIVSYKAFIDSYSDALSEFLNVPREFYYSQFNKLLRVSTSTSYNEFFFDAVNSMRLNKLAFSVYIEAGSFVTVKIVTKVNVQINPQWSPKIFMFKYIPLGTRQIDLSVRLNSNYPYLLESNLAMTKNNDSYTFSSDALPDSFYCVFSSAENPVNLSGDSKNDDPRKNNLLLWICIPIASVAAIVLIISLVMIVKEKRSRLLRH